MGSGAKKVSVVLFLGCLALACSPRKSTIEIQNRGAGTMPQPASPEALTLFDNQGIPGPDLTVFRPSNGSWYSRYAEDNYLGGYSFQAWGVSDDIPLAADFNGDGTMDIAIYRPAEGAWDIMRIYWGGQPGDIPVAGDFDGDGKADIAIYRPSDGTWNIRYSGDYNAVKTETFQWGIPGDIPIVADFDGDGKADLAVFRPSNGTWYIRYSSSHYSYSDWQSFQWGLPGDIPIAADFDGDGKADLVVFRPSNGTWYVRYSSSNYSYADWQSFQWGLPGDIPMAADFDGDGKADLVVWRPSEATWYIRYSSNNYSYDTWRQVQWGLPGDIPLLLNPWNFRTPVRYYGPRSVEVGKPKSTLDLSLALGTDGNLVLYRSQGTQPPRVLWESQTGGRSCGPDCSAEFQGDGNLVLYQGGVAYWNSGTSGHPNAQLALSDTAPYISIRDSGQVLWSGGNHLTWFATLDNSPSYPPPLTGASDFKQIFQPGSPWSTARSYTGIYKIWWQFAINGSDEELRNVFSYLRRNHIALAMEAELVTPPPGCPTGEGVTPYMGTNVSDYIATRIKRLGGDLAYVAMDEPLGTAYYDDRAQCGFTPASLGQNVALAANAYRNVFPAVQVGDIEPFFIGEPPSTWASDYAQFLDAFEAGTGARMAFVHDDDTAGPSWRNHVAELEALLAARQIPYGVIWDGYNADTSDEDWIRNAEAHFLEYDFLGLPPMPQNIFQSWNPYPTHALPETDPLAFTHLIDYFESLHDPNFSGPCPFLRNDGTCPGQSDPFAAIGGGYCHLGSWIPPTARQIVPACALGFP
jgi:hypothetical protein